MRHTFHFGAHLHIYTHTHIYGRGRMEEAIRCVRGKGFFLSLIFLVSGNLRKKPKQSRIIRMYMGAASANARAARTSHEKKDENGKR